MRSAVPYCNIGVAVAAKVDSLYCRSFGVEIEREREREKYYRDYSQAKRSKIRVQPIGTTVQYYNKGFRVFWPSINVSESMTPGVDGEQDRSIDRVRQWLLDWY